MAYAELSRPLDGWMLAGLNWTGHGGSLLGGLCACISLIHFPLSVTFKCPGRESDIAATYWGR